MRLSYHYKSEYVGPLRSKKPSKVLKLDKLERDPGGAKEGLEVHGSPGDTN